MSHRHQLLLFSNPCHPHTPLGCLPQGHFPDALSGLHPSNAATSASGTFWGNYLHVGLFPLLKLCLSSLCLYILPRFSTYLLHYLAQGNWVKDSKLL
jgi:hypothetical protein